MSNSRIDIATGAGETITAQIARLPAEHGQVDLSGLRRADRERAARMSNPLRRAQFVAGRTLLAELLSDRAQEWSIELAPSGQPEAWCDARRVAVSLSHSGPWVAAAVGPVAGLGIDIEVSPRDRDFRRLARRLGWPVQNRSQFLRRWALWEASGKSRGLGALRKADEVFDALVGLLADGLEPGPVQAGEHAGLLMPLAHGDGWLGLVALETTLGNMRIATAPASP